MIVRFFPSRSYCLALDWAINAGMEIDCSALHRASNFSFFHVRFCVDGRGAAAGLGLVEDRHDFETESTTRKMQVGKKGKELKGRNCEKVPSPARCALRTSSTVGTT